MNRCDKNDYKLVKKQVENTYFKEISGDRVVLTNDIVIDTFDFGNTHELISSRIRLDSILVEKCMNIYIPSKLINDKEHINGLNLKPVIDDKTRVVSIPQILLTGPFDFSYDLRRLDYLHMTDGYCKTKYPDLYKELMLTNKEEE